MIQRGSAKLQLGHAGEGVESATSGVPWQGLGRLQLGHAGEGVERSIGSVMVTGR